MTRQGKIQVLFMQSQAYFGSDSMIHSLIMGHLDPDRFVVHVACNKGPGEEKSPALAALERIPGIRIRATNFGPTVNARTRRQIASDAAANGAVGAFDMARLVTYARRNRIDIVHGTEKPRDAFYGLLLARSVGAKAVTHLHVGVEDWISPLSRWAMKHDDALIGVSKFVADTAVAKGYGESKVSWVLNSIDATRWDDKLDGWPVRQELGLGDDVPVISSISRLFPWKGHGLMLDALAKMKADGHDFRYVVVGEDDPRATPGGGSYLAHLREQTRQLGLDDEVLFTGFRQDVDRVLAASDIYAMPSYEEPCAVAFLEAMAMGRPVVALASGGTPQLVDDGRTGLLSAPGDTDGLASHLAALVSEPELRTSMGSAARDRVLRDFHPRRLATDVEKVYRRVLGDERG